MPLNLLECSSQQRERSQKLGGTWFHLGAQPCVKPVAPIHTTGEMANIARVHELPRWVLCGYGAVLCHKLLERVVCLASLCFPQAVLLWHVVVAIGFALVRLASCRENETKRQSHDQLQFVLVS